MDAEWCVGYLNILIGQTEIKHLQVMNNDMPQFLKKSRKIENTQQREIHESVILNIFSIFSSIFVKFWKKHPYSLH